MFTNCYRSPRRSSGPVSIEHLEARSLLAGGPFIHVHDNRQLAVVDVSTGEVQEFASLDEEIADIGFDSSARLFGVTSERLFEIHPATGELTDLGAHGVANANSMVFGNDGRLYVMGRDAPRLFVIADINRPDQRIQITLSGLDSDIGANGDISFLGSDLIVASADGRLLQYRFDVGPTRPRIVADRALSRTDIFGLATVGQTLFGLTDDSLLTLNLTAPSVVQREIQLPGSTLDVIRGAAYFAEAGGSIPVGTLSGISWDDQNGDGVRQFQEPLLADWEVFVDQNVNGVRDATEPHSRTDANGRYFLFGNLPGLHTVQQINADTGVWLPSSPQSPHPNLAGVYDFRDGTARNHLFHDFGLPDLTAFSVALDINRATITNAISHLELGTDLGTTPFTIAIDATYQPAFGAEQFLVSQRLSDTAADQDFTLSIPSGSPAVSASFCNRNGTCDGPLTGTIDAQRRSYALTWDGTRVGAFFGDRLTQEQLSGTLPDIDGTVVRIGNPVTRQTAPAALTGTIHEIRVFNKSLTEAEQQNAFSDVTQPAGYTVWIQSDEAIGSLDFGNRRLTSLIPEIEVRRTTLNGPIVTSGSTIDLGAATANEDPPSTDLWIRNTGTSALQITGITATAGFNLSGSTSATLPPGQSLNIDVSVSDRTVGSKTGEIRIANNDSDENPFVISVTAQIIDETRSVLINDAAGTIHRFFPQTGRSQVAATGVLYAVDQEFLYRIELSTKAVTTLFAHGIRNASALAFAANGDLFAAGEQVYQIDVDAGTSSPFSFIIRDLAGDMAMVGNQLFVSAESGNLYRVTESSTTLVGNMNRLSMRGLAVVDSTLYGFANNEAYVINPANATVALSASLAINGIQGGTAPATPIADPHNDDNPLDVNGDEAITPLDALLIINELNSPQYIDPQSGRIISSPPANSPFPDVNDDGFLAPIDAILIINFLNREGAPAIPAPASGTGNLMPTPGADVDDTMARDIALSSLLMPDADAARGVTHRRARLVKAEDPLRLLG
jgi:hypothetical protein